MKTDCLLKRDKDDDFSLNSVLIKTVKIDMFFKHLVRTKREKRVSLSVKYYINKTTTTENDIQYH